MKKIVNTTPPESISLQEVSDNFMAYTVFVKYKNDLVGIVLYDMQQNKYYFSTGVWDKYKNGNGFLTLNVLIESFPQLDFYAQRGVTVTLS